MHQQKSLTRHLAHALLALSAVTLLPSSAIAADASHTAAINHPARAADTKDDAKRKPATFLEFAQVKPGMKVLDIFAGGGATSQLLALAVGPTGAVYEQGQCQP